MNDYFEAARNTGVVEVQPQSNSGSGRVVFWVGPGLPFTFLTNGAVKAYWSGNRLVVEMEGGIVRSYSNFYDYDIIRC